MLDAAVIGIWDKKATCLDQERSNRNVFEFDLTLWSLLSSLAKENPELVASQFSMNANTVSLLANASSQQLHSLSSGVLISFKLKTPEENILSRLSESYEPAVFVRERVDAFDAAYWLLLSKVSAYDVDMAREIFGVSDTLIKAVLQATDSQLRHMASSIVTQFKLRFCPSLVETILAGNSEDLTHLLLVKFQQSLSQNTGTPVYE